MAKESGLGFSVTVDDSAGTGRNISNDIKNVSVRTPSGIQDITGLDKSAIERLVLLADGEVTLNGVFNDAANMSHAVFKDYRTLLAGQVGRTVALAHSGQTLSMEMVAENYDLTRADDGSLTWAVTLRLSDGTVPAWS